ncbi:MAG: leucine--tRNA ligase [Verrucomicrobiota bacterium]|jgi:leucyl-tRNA synthetase
MRRQYPFHLIEPKWQQFWDAQSTFRAWNPLEPVPPDHPFALRHGLRGPVPPDRLPPKFYILDMFPYPSGAGLHVGHPEGYTATDILARYRRALGCNVLHPMGWDAFGLPAEQYAIRTGQHPRQTTQANIAVFKRQIKALGFSYDWTREIDTTDPGYFKWTQWIFLKLYNSWFNPATKKAEPLTTLPEPPGDLSPAAIRQYRDNQRLAYVTEAPVWWCEELGTVLANEEVVEGKSEVGGFPVVRRPMRQWMLRITAYADRLLEGLDKIHWSDSLKDMQRNWIGRSEGARVSFRVGRILPGPLKYETRYQTWLLPVFTTRPDTLFGATYMVLAPEHPMIAKWLEHEVVPTHWPEGTPDSWKGGAPSPRAAVEQYRQFAAARSDLERTETSREKTGVFIGVYADNPVNSERIPVWIADYVLASYGTGAIMAVPAHDARDLDFARKFGLPVRLVVQAPVGADSIGFLGDGISVNSGFLSGLPTPAAKKKVVAWLDEKKLGRKTVNYKLRDWLFSRQRYWGEPFPIVWRPDGHEPIPESLLPLRPPELSDFKPTPAGEPPLARAKDWVALRGGAFRETNTMPQWAGSCWYFLRFLDPNNAAAFVGPEAEHYWMGAHPAAAPGVDLYVGGIEHAVLHLLYARFWHNVLFDLGYVSTPEPFFKLVNQGLILGEDGQKMSKSRGNVVNPDDVLLQYGADSFRLYEMFLGPLEMVKPWNTRGVEGVYRFLGRVWRLFVDEQSQTDFDQSQTARRDEDPAALEKIQLSPAVQHIPPSAAQLKTLHTCIKKVTEDLDAFRFNTAISALMVFINDAITWETRPASILRDFLVLLHPFAPHLAEELFAKLTAAQLPPPSLSYQPWPKFDPALLVEETIEIPVQINGKLRDRIVIAPDASNADIESAALAGEKIKLFLEGRPVKKFIIIPRKLVNIVA